MYVDPNSKHYGDFRRWQKKLLVRLVALRKEHKYTQAELADMSGISVRQIERMETDPEKIVSLWNIYRLAKALDLPPEYLIDTDQPL